VDTAGLGDKTTVDSNLIEWNYGEYEGADARADPTGRPLI